MRLIDADELKIVIRDNPYLMENLNDDNFECVLDLIDNAPTVNPCDNCDFIAKTKEEMRKGGKK